MSELCPPASPDSTNRHEDALRAQLTGILSPAGSTRHCVSLTHTVFSLCLKCRMGLPGSTVWKGKWLMGNFVSLKDGSEYRGVDDSLEPTPAPFSSHLTPTVCLK